MSERGTLFLEFGISDCINKFDYKWFFRKGKTGGSQVEEIEDRSCEALWMV